MIDRNAEKYKSETDWEILISKRVDQKFNKFSSDIINEHNKTRKVVEEAIITMKSTQYSKVHIIILYILSLANLLILAFTLSGGLF